MMDLRRLALLAVGSAVILLIARGGLLAAKITVDPNAPGAATPKEIAVAADSRLSQKITYHVQRRAVRDILQDLSDMTGVKLIAGASKNDWPVRDRKMNIFVRETKLSDLMNSVARVMKFKWTSSEDLKPPVYRLIVDRKDAIAADMRKQQAEEKSENYWRARRQEWVDIIMRDGTMTPSQVEATRETDPVFYRYARGGHIRALHALFTEVPEAKNRFAEGRNFRISTDKLSEDTHQLIYQAANEFKKFMQRGRWPIIGFADEMKPEQEFDVAYIRLDVGSFTPNWRWGLMSHKSTGYFHVSRGSWDPEIVDLKDKNSELAKALCERENIIIDTDERGPADDLFNTRVPKMRAEFTKEEEELYPSEPLEDQSDTPELSEVVRLKMPDREAEEGVRAYCRDVADFQGALADATGMGIVSDSWISVRGDRPENQEATLRDLLVKFSKSFNYNWRQSGELLEFRHRKRWKNRLTQIPDGWVDEWRSNTRKNGVLSLEDLASISTLNYYQAEESLKADEVLGLGSLYDQVLSILDGNLNLQWLRLYNSLTPSLRTLLTERNGVNGFMLTQDQWKLGQVMFDRIGSSRGDALFRLERVPHEKELIYRFREIDTESGEEDRTWEITLPRYTPPPEKQEQKP